VAGTIKLFTVVIVDYKSRLQALPANIRLGWK
jgi:hypothetical protein